MKAKTIILESFVLYLGMVAHACNPRIWGAEKGNMRNLRAALATQHNVSYKPFWVISEPVSKNKQEKDRKQEGRKEERKARN